MERRRRGEDTWQVSARVMLLQVMSLLLLKALVQVFVLLMKALMKVAGLFSLSPPLTQTQTTMPQTRPGRGVTSRFFFQGLGNSVRGRGRAQTQPETFPRRDSCFY